MYIDFYNALRGYAFWDFYTQYCQKMRFCRYGIIILKAHIFTFIAN